MSEGRGRDRNENDFLDMLNNWDVHRDSADEREERRQPEDASGGGGSGAGELLRPGQGPKRRRQRAKTGKRSNPDWTLASCFVEKKVYWAVREGLASRQRALGRKVDYSELVNELLKEWCDEQGLDPDDAPEGG